MPSAPSAHRVQLGITSVELKLLLAIMSYERVLGYAPLRKEIEGFLPHSLSRSFVRLESMGAISPYYLIGHCFVHTNLVAWSHLGFDPPNHLTAPGVYAEVAA